MNVMLPVRPGSDLRAAWTVPLLGLALGLVAFGILFWQEGVAAVATWERSAAYTHCWLVLPVAGWLAWVRRDRLAVLRPAPSLILALPALGGAALWLVAERLGIMEGRQLAVIGLVWVLVLSVLGWRIALAMAAPLCYLVFLVPFGEFLTPSLQNVTLQMILVGLRLFGVPHYSDGMIIEIPAGTFLVAEACAGLRFLIAALAFGALYALVMFRSPGRRLVVMLLALVVPVVANGLRALGIVMWGHHLGSAQAAAADHIIYGWVFFSFVILLLVLAGLPFRQDAPETKRVPDRLAALRTTPRTGPRGLVVAAFLALVAATGPLAAARLDAGVPPLRQVAAALAIAPGCTTEGLSLRCEGATVTAQLLVFDAATNWSAVAAARRAALSRGNDEALVISLNLPGMAWQLRQEAERPGLVGVAAWRAGIPAGDGLRSRLAQALSGLRGGQDRPVLAVVELIPDPRAPVGAEAQRRLMRTVLAAQGDALAADAALLSLSR